MTAPQDKEFDLVVVGCGISGCSAAVSALQKNLSVAILERAPQEEYGGNTRYTEANIRMKNETEISDDFEASLSENAGANPDPNVIAAIAQPYEQWPSIVKAHCLTDPEIITTLASNAVPTIKWLSEFGIKFDKTPSPSMLTVSSPRIRPVGGGLALIEALSNYAQQRGTEFFYEHTAYKLMVDGTGRVSGVFARDNSGVSKPIRGKAVVLAAGGFQGNPEMLAQYIGKRAEFIRPVARGGYYNKGEGIRMGIEVGAATAGDFGSYHAEPVDPRSKRANAVIYSYPYGILVNMLGRRFIDEAPGPVDSNYDHISRIIADQPKGVVHVIYDRRIDDIPNWKRSVKSEHPAIVADTLEHLASKLEIPADALIKTVNEYNAACVAGDFKPFEVDHLSTINLDPPKSNWARPLDTGPYGAYPIMSANCFTYGGLKINSKAQVLDSDGRPIIGLYAAGENMGLYHQIYTGATSVLRGAVFGRIAGLTHAASLGKI